MRIGAPLAFVDIETTGGARDSRILEIGIIRVEGAEIVDSYQTLLNPIGYVPGMITRLTGITTADVQGAPDFATVAPRVVGLLEGAAFVAHNVRFDYGFMRSELAAVGVMDFAPPLLCTVQLSRRLFPQYRHHNLSDIIARHCIEVNARHRAYDDALALWQLYQLILYEHDLDTVETAIARQLDGRPAVPQARPLPGRLAVGRPRDV